jgi:hypothetical protein
MVTTGGEAGKKERKVLGTRTTSSQEEVHVLQAAA